MDSRSVAVIVGSLRQGAMSRKVARALMAVAPESLRCGIVEIRALTLYDQDVQDAGAPESWTEFRDAIRSTDGVLFVTPEYNRSVPGVLKNAVDIGSRPGGKSAWRGKPAGVVSVSNSRFSGLGASHHLRQSLVSLDMPAMAQPEACVGGSEALFGPDGVLTDEPTRALFAKFMTAFAAWVELHAGARPRP